MFSNEVVRNNYFSSGQVTGLNNPGDCSETEQDLTNGCGDPSNVISCTARPLSSRQVMHNAEGELASRLKREEMEIMRNYE